MGIVIRKITFWVAVAAAVAVFIAIFVLTEQNPSDTTALSASVSDAIVSRPADAGGAVALGVSTAGERAAGPIEAMLSIGNVRKWAHTAEFFAFGVPVALASALWWGRPRGARPRVLAAVGVCALASLFDQTHKLFVPGREFDAGDLLFDLLGYCAAIAFVLLVCMALKRIPSVGRHAA